MRRRGRDSRQTLGWAPYRPGDAVRVRHVCGEDRVVHVADVEVRRVEAVQGLEVGDYRYRVIAVRCDGELLKVDVNDRGFSRSGSVQRLDGVPGPVSQDEESAEVGSW